jgi:leucyl-tRNA synthetase
VLYAARPQRTHNWSDSAVLRAHRFLTQVWEFSQSRLAQAEALASGEQPAADQAPADGEPARDTTEHLRLKLHQWCERGVEKITEDMDGLEMHSTVRNIMRLFDRIKDFEKRVIARQGTLGRADSDALIQALSLLAQLLGPIAPHISEELWIAFGADEHGAQPPWPGVSLTVAA